ncbi:phosphate propanoyltransferase [Halobacillus sp. Marseille-Q1614]|uniref:phosphate propanoyltransferase n=1 Tax=Halobacillus sp. Marseille-Q1614 TaxID=2709134 RepID=UPI0015703AB1|nr:phosphate propanoyltransferase [Halobacillus sp. Marseille-Q1614]
MNQLDIERIVDEVIGTIHNTGEIPIGVSARHCHLNQPSLDILFGKGYELTKKKSLSQPGQFACEETVMIAGPRGSISNVRILGPLRSATQVEISQTDAFKIGAKPPIRQSGHIKSSSPVTIIGPKASLHLDEGLIIAQAHIHMAPKDAEHFNVQNGEVVEVAVESGPRPIKFSKTVIRVSEKYQLEMHIDTDEANAGSVKTGQSGKLIKQESRYG